MEQEILAPEEAGRGTDTVMAHMSLGEVVIPREFLSDPDVMQMLEALFQQNGASLNEFTVGDPANKINPETGYPEVGFFKSIGKFLSKAAPIAAAFIPGLQPLAAAGIGAGAGLLGGGGLKSALLGAATGYAGAGGLGDTVLGRGIDSLKTGISDTVLGRGVSDIYNGISGAVGGSPIQGPLQPGAGALGKTGGLGGALSSATGGGSSFVNTAANVFGGLNQDAAIKKQQKQLLGANNQQLANLDSFDPSGITSDPGYQFKLEQGQEGLNKQLAASGALGSGRAIKAATQYNQDYANNAFQSYYQRWLQKTQGQNALIGNSGDIRAQATGAGAQNLSQSLSNALGTQVGDYGGNLTLEQLRKLGMAV